VPIRPVPGRRSRILQGGYEPVTNVSIAVISTIVVFAVIVLSIVNSPGWERVKSSFFNATEARDAFPLVARAFLLNVKMFTIAEVFILTFALLLAVVRSLPGPVFFPLRLMVIVYTDLFRGVPTILVFYILGFGMPALQLTGIPTSPVFWGVVSLVLVYSAYVAEVYRAGIESVHPSQEAAARSLGLSRGQTLRFVIVPQAVRRVIPPLLNDFIGLQKDTALVSVLGAVDALQQANINSAADFNYTPYIVASFFFVLLTIPLARFTDWLIERERRRRQSGGLV
jgi:polar amino acid transport system permease protein